MSPLLQIRPADTRSVRLCILIGRVSTIRLDLRGFRVTGDRRVPDGFGLRQRKVSGSNRKWVGVPEGERVGVVSPWVRVSSLEVPRGPTVTSPAFR